MPEIKIELISVGDEILLGHTVDSNANWIERQLVNIGHQLRYHSTVGDNQSDMLEAFELACDRSQVIIVMGGLGPTHDDITRPVLAKFFDDTLEIQPAIKKVIDERYTERDITPPPGLDIMTQFPTKAVPILNDQGSAPGIHFSERGIDLFAVPGVPSEMKEMISTYILKLIREKGSGTYRYHLFRAAGIGESYLSEKIGDCHNYLPVKMAFLPSIDNGVTLRLSHSGTNPDKVETVLTNKVSRVRKKIKKYVYTEDERTLEEILYAQLHEKNLRLAVAESCTGGMICDRIVSVAGSSKIFDWGFITYSDRAKIEQLNVSEETLKSCGAVSEETAIEMARGVMEIAGTDIGLSVTGISGPTGGTLEKPLGLTYVGLCDRNSSQARKFNFIGDRNTNSRRAALAALTFLWKHINCV